MMTSLVIMQVVIITVIIAVSPELESGKPRFPS